MQSNKCSICDEPTLQTSILLKQLKKRLIQKNKEHDQEYQQIKCDQKTNHNQIFNKLLDMLGLPINQNVNVCPHRKTCKDFYKKMRCSQQEFKRNCQQMIMELANRTYQLDVISQQISLFQDRVLEIVKKSQISNKQYKSMYKVKRQSNLATKIKVKEKKNKTTTTKQKTQQKQTKKQSVIMFNNQININNNNRNNNNININIDNQPNINYINSLQQTQTLKSQIPTFYWQFIFPRFDH